MDNVLTAVGRLYLSIAAYCQTSKELLQKGYHAKLAIVDILSDVQRALFRLDQLAQNRPGLRNIFNFERLVYVRDLAREFIPTGKLDDGARMLEDALQRTSAQDHCATLGSCWLLNSLGTLYNQENNASLAKETQQMALACQVQKLPSDHFDVVLTMNELGRIFSAPVIDQWSISGGIVPRTY